MRTNLKKMRDDFPIFHTKPDWAYLDTAATSQVPQVVIDAVAEFQCAYRSSVHRGLYREALRATEVYEQARSTVAGFLNAESSEEVIFTYGATASSNMLIAMLEHSGIFTEGDELVTTITEHHSSLVPQSMLAQRIGLTMSCIPMKHSFLLDYEYARSVVTQRTKLVSVMLASNVTGTIHNVRRIARMAHAVGALVVCDATAAAGHLPIDVRALEVDFLYFSGHKMGSPMGIGALYGKRELLRDLEPGWYGGGMVEEVTCTGARWTDGPQRFEAGTPNIAGAIGLATAVRYLAEHNMVVIRQYIEALLVRAVEELRAIDGVQVFTAAPHLNVGIVSFVVEGVHAHDVAEIAAREGVALRAGHHCAMPLHEALGVSATVRASFFLYNTKHDVDALVAAVKKAKRVFGA
ncbi:MAG: cysteine desulfurase [Candidatus Pacebacteria bacterium]|nr:cysteine desulfurase [Candidatus Paceibacterota bacterium]